MEFSEHRDYVPGDDLRHLDWNVYARLERFAVKIFQAELEQPVRILFDSSASMAWSKLPTAAALAGSLAFVALAAGDRAGLVALREGLPLHPTVRGVGQWIRLARFLQQQKAEGQAALSHNLKRFGLRHSRPGQAIVISDFLEPDGGLEGLRHLLYQKHRLTLIQVLSPHEIEPEVRGDVRLSDMEIDAHRELTVDGRVLRHFRQCLQEHNQKLRDWCRRHGCFFFQITTPPGEQLDENFLEHLVARELCQAGLLR